LPTFARARAWSMPRLIGRNGRAAAHRSLCVCLTSDRYRVTI